MEVILILVGIVVVILLLRSWLKPVAQQAKLQNLESRTPTISDDDLERVRRTIKKGWRKIVKAPPDEQVDVFADVVKEATGGGGMTVVHALKLGREQHSRLPKRFQALAEPGLLALMNAALAKHHVDPVTGKDWDRLFEVTLRAAASVERRLSGSPTTHLD